MRRAEPASGGSAPPRLWHFRIKNRPRSNDMSITDNVLQKTAKTASGGSHDRAVSPAEIVVGDRLRALDRQSVERLKESISRSV